MTEIVCACVCAHVRVCVNIDVFLTLLYYHDQDAKSSYTVMIDSHIVLLYVYSYCFLRIQHKNYLTKTRR